MALAALCPALVSSLVVLTASALRGCVQRSKRAILSSRQAAGSKSKWEHLEDSVAPLAQIVAQRVREARHPCVGPVALSACLSKPCITALFAPRVLACPSRPGGAAVTLALLCVQYVAAALHGGEGFAGLHARLQALRGDLLRAGANLEQWRVPPPPPPPPPDNAAADPARLIQVRTSPCRTLVAAHPGVAGCAASLRMAWRAVILNCAGAVRAGHCGGGSCCRCSSEPGGGGCSGGGGGT